ncbi:MAG: hypothetical protein VB081_14710 [Christensenella sp.]|uniref:hypothetical protein n=1 Tax=Christensenella sp. TaxID=1935934 RepID=UPI002B1ECA1D|nr:hypothetical protein [Christensenella sp.]MEA5004736.1 hypothetical protein [Christensenella sp.]
MNNIPGERDWYQLDTAAKIYPSISQTHNNTTFRLMLELDEQVDRDKLQEALVKIMPRFPSFAVTLRRGMFWYYLEPNDALPIVKEETGFPCKRLKDFINNGFLFNVTYYKKNVIMECFHGLSDGAGAIEFLKTLLYEYFKLCGYDMDAEGMVLDADGKVNADEVENSFNTYYDAEGEFNKLKQPKAYHILGTRNDENGIFLTHGIVDLKQLLAHVKTKGVTVSAYIAALLLYCIAKEQLLIQRKVKQPIIVSVPMDLRSMFPSHTLRNFVSFANVGMSVEGELDFDMILTEISRQLKEGLTKERISANINKNVKYEQNPFIRMTPLFMKNIVVSNSYKSYGEGAYTVVLSNLRTAQFPKTMRSHIKQVYYALGVSEMNPMNCVVVSYQDKMVFTLARGIRETGITRSFFEHFSKELNMDVEVRGNGWNTK